MRKPAKRRQGPVGRRQTATGNRLSAPRDTPPAPEPLLDSPRAILDEALADAARTVALAASGGDVTREQLAASQDVLTRMGITGATAKESAFPEAFARAAFGEVFRLLGFPPIRWPRGKIDPVEVESARLDDFSQVLADSVRG